MPLSASHSLRKKLVPVKCPHCRKGVITRVPACTDLRKIITYSDKFEDIIGVQVHKCPKCGYSSGVEVAK
jgi:predicted RNA-binding Zn-ribbon protein involved in translation (DUF1610 family)